MTTPSASPTPAGKSITHLLVRGARASATLALASSCPTKPTHSSQLDGGSPTPNVEGRGRGHWRRLAQLRPSKLSRNRAGEGQRQDLGGSGHAAGAWQPRARAPGS